MLFGAYLCKPTDKLKITVAADASSLNGAMYSGQHLDQHVNGNGLQLFTDGQQQHCKSARIVGIRFSCNRTLN